MSNFFVKLKYHVERFLFENLALPKVKNEKISKVILKKYLPPNPVVIDCGSHDGSDSIEFAKLLKKATIHSFEPVDELYSRLVKNTKPYNNILTYQLALADRNGKMDFYISEGASDASSSLLQPKDHLIFHPNTYFKRKIIVNTLMLDTWAEQQRIKKIDLLWLDMQGFELNMLMASNILLPTVKVIHMEVSTKEIYEGISLYAECRSYLERKGFQVLLEAIPEGWHMGNVLFVRK